MQLHNLTPPQNLKPSKGEMKKRKKTKVPKKEKMEDCKSPITKSNRIKRIIQEISGLTLNPRILQLSKKELKKSLPGKS